MPREPTIPESTNPSTGHSSDILDHAAREPVPDAQQDAKVVIVIEDDDEQLDAKAIMDRDQDPDQQVHQSGYINAESSPNHVSIPYPRQAAYPPLNQGAFYSPTAYAPNQEGPSQRPYPCTTGIFATPPLPSLPTPPSTTASDTSSERHILLQTSLVIKTRASPMGRHYPSAFAKTTGTVADARSIILSHLKLAGGSLPAGKFSVELSQTNATGDRGRGNFDVRIKRESFAADWPYVVDQLVLLGDGPGDKRFQIAVMAQ